MTLIVRFGMDIKKEVNWYKDMMAFPKFIRFQGKKWEWAMYNTIGSVNELTFAQLHTYDPNFYIDMESFEEMFEWGSNSDKCECGANYTSFSFDHMRYCKKWTKW